MKIGIVIADAFEYNPFCAFAETRNAVKSVRHGRSCITYTDGDKTVTAVQCGIGKVNAATAAAFLLAEGCEVILNAGLSGAVSGLLKGDVVAGESFTECDFDLRAIGRTLGEKPDQPSVFYADEKLLALADSLGGVKRAKLGTGDVFLSDKERAKTFHQLFGIHAFDMETAAIASVCTFEKVPFLSLRKISDNADDAATDDYREMNDRQEMDLTLLLAQIIKKIERF